jgi:uncharacterized GH25 family protein
MRYFNRTLDEKLLVQLSKVYLGHELWIDTPSLTADTVSCHLRYGHNMNVDGVAPKNYVNSIVYTPDDRSLRANEKLEKDGYLLSCKKTSDGDFTFYIDSSSVWCQDKNKKWTMGPKSSINDVTYSGAFQLVAKKIVPVNSAGMFMPISYSVLDILPEAREIRVGDSITFNVSYDGKKLNNSQMKAYCKEADVDRMVEISNGKATTTIDHKGTWMFLVRLRDETKKVNEEYDETVFVTTLVMETI